MSKHGTKKILDTFIQTSPIITENPPHLRATISPKDTREDEELTKVTISIISMHWVQRALKEGSSGNYHLYKFFKEHDLQKSRL